MTLRPFRLAFLALLVASCDPVVTTDDDAAVDDASSDFDAGPPDLITHDVRIIVEPSDDGAMMVAAIDGATASVHMTMYLLTDSDVIDALVRAHGRHLDVRVVLNQSFPGGTSPTNDATFTELATAGIIVHWAPARFALTHEKCMVIDGREAWIMTMNAASSSPSTNREYLAVDHEPVDIHDADAIFEADYAGTDYPSYAGPLLLAPVNAQARLFDLITHAQHTIDVEVEELSDTNIVNALVGAAGRGIAVRIVISERFSSLTSAQQGAATNLMNAGIPIRYLSTPDIHAKAIVIDNALAYVGSINLTAASITHNRELGLVTDNAAAVSTVATTIAADFTAGRAI